MLYETPHFTIAADSHIGHMHKDANGNCQDSFAVSIFPEASPDPWIVGVVSDGCGGADINTPNGKISCRSEVGSALVSEFVASELRYRLAGGHSPQWCLEDAIDNIFEATRRFIGQQVQELTSDEVALAIQKYWLCTIRGFIINSVEGYIFSAGDGITEIEYRGLPAFSDDQRDVCPAYLAYKCINSPASYGIPDELVKAKPHCTSQPGSDIQRLFVASDGFNNHCERKLLLCEKAIGSPLPRSLRGQQWGKKGRTGMKRWLNLCFDKGYFDDDVAIIAVERKDD